MKLTNYKRGYINKFDCSIHGTIRIGKRNVATVIRLLSEMPEDCSYPWVSRLALERLNIGDKSFCLGVTATEYLVRCLGLKGYKNGNYQFIVS